MNKVCQALCIFGLIIILGSLLNVKENYASAYSHRSDNLEKTGINDGWNNSQPVGPSEKTGHKNPPGGIILASRRSSLPQYNYKPCDLGTRCANL